MLELLPNNPIVNAGLLYINGLQIANVDPVNPSKTLFLNAGAARNSTNVSDIILSSNIMLNGASVGPNGVDLAPLVANTFYGVYVMADSTKNRPTIGLFSLATNNNPLLLAGYDMFQRVGWIRTDSSANIMTFWQYGQGDERMYYYDVGITALSNGASTAPAVINLANSVPPISTEVLFQAIFTPSVATSVAKFFTYGLASPLSIIAIFGYGVAAAQSGMITVPAHLQPIGINPSILYQVNLGDTLTLITSGYKDYLV